MARKPKPSRKPGKKAAGKRGSKTKKTAKKK